MRKPIPFNQRDWLTIQKEHDNGMFWTSLQSFFHIDKKILNKAIKMNLLIRREIPRRKYTHTEETKAIISECKKKLYAENPDSHPWKNNKKFISPPCEFLKKKLTEDGILFIEEHHEIEWGRGFNLDIAFPNHKIAIEVNGNQHYLRDGKGILKPYYQERHDFFIRLEWTVIEVQYKLIYNDEFRTKLINQIKNYSLNENEYFHFSEIQSKPKNINKCVDCNTNISKNATRCKECSDNKRRNSEKISKYKCIDCGNPIYIYSTRCGYCEMINKRKIERPDYNMLINEINELGGYEAVGRKYDVTGASIKKWIKFYENHS